MNKFKTAEKYIVTAERVLVAFISEHFTTEPVLEKQAEMRTRFCSAAALDKVTKISDAEIAFLVGDCDEDDPKFLKVDTKYHNLSEAIGYFF